jgi:hypothetical protein
VCGVTRASTGAAFTEPPPGEGGYVVAAPNQNSRTIKAKGTQKKTKRGGGARATGESEDEER